MTSVMQSENPFSAIDSRTTKRLMDFHRDAVEGYDPLVSWEFVAEFSAKLGLKAQIEHIRKDYGSGVWNRFAVRYSLASGASTPITSLIAPDGKVHTELDGVRVPGCRATSDTQSIAYDLEAAVKMYRNRPQGTSYAPFVLPQDWNGAVQVKGCVLDSSVDDSCVTWAESAGQPPSFFGVYGQRTSGLYAHVADFPDESTANLCAQALEAMARKYGNEVPDFWDRWAYDVPGRDDPHGRDHWNTSWSFKESAQAQSEGWDVFRDVTTRRHLIGYYSRTPTTVKSELEILDASASERVVRLARDGSPLHLKALVFVVGMKVLTLDGPTVRQLLAQQGQSHAEPHSREHPGTSEQEEELLAEGPCP
jgi:hypothetical protein